MEIVFLMIFLEIFSIRNNMIKILEHGIRKITCPNCKAKLQYEQEDIISEKRLNGKSWIICPDCNKEIIIDKGTSETDFDL